jgi:ABC-type lipoprotein release transport system permease subunit
MVMNIFISAILIKIVFSIVYHNKKRDIAYFYSLGMSKKEIIKLFMSEVVFVGFILITGSIIFSNYIMTLINETYILKNMFHIVLKLNKFFICSYDIYFLIAFVYLIVAFLTGIKPIKEAVNYDYIDVLRGE